MTSIMLALLSGVLTIKQASEMSVVCMASTPKEETLVINCCSMHEDKILRCAKVEGTGQKISVEELSNMWAITLLESMKFPKAEST